MTPVTDDLMRTEELETSARNRPRTGVHFDARLTQDLYRFFFKKAIEDLGIECTRCDEIEEAGSIHEKMFEHIYYSDIVVVDITTSNANVYYELGIRHALVPWREASPCCYAARAP